MRLVNFFNVVLACAAGYLGGTLASRAPMQAHAAAPDVVRASKFELVDAAGRAVARWETDPKTKDVHLYFIGKGGVARLDAGIRSTEKPFLFMKGRDGEDRLWMALDQYDEPGLHMGDERWQGRLFLGHVGSDTPDIPDTTDEWALSLSPRRASPSAVVSVRIRRVGNLLEC